MSNKEEKIVLSEAEISELKAQAADFLASRYFYAAKDQYDKILENNPNDGDGHIGVLMCNAKVNTREDLIKYYQDLYSVEQREIKLALEKDERHIEEMCEKNVLEGYLEKDEIYRAYDFDLSYHSCLFFRKKQKEEMVRFIDHNRDLLWLKENGFKEIYDILWAYDKRIDEAEKEDNENIERIRNEYQRFLYKTYGQIRDLNKSAKEKKEEDYKGLIREYETCFDVDQLRDLSLRFEKFADYKDGKKYIEDCLNKIEQIKSQEKDLSFRKAIGNSVDEAKADLVKGDFSKAYDGFTRVLSLLPDNEEAHLGILMARTRTVDEDSLFDYYEHLYDEGKSEVLEACEEDRSHIDEMVRKYVIEDYLEKEQIEEKYLFDRSYRSSLKSRESEKERFIDDVGSDPNLLWLQSNGSRRIRERIASVFDAYDLRIKEARKEDERHVRQIKNDYQRFLFKTYANIRDLYKKADEQKKERYKKLIKSYELSSDERELQRIIEDLKEFGDYREAAKYILLAEKKIQDIRDRKQKDHVEREIQSSLVAAKAYLSSGNTRMADETFSEVLELDPENARAYLGIVMIETGCKDVEELISYYSNLYTDDSKEILQACKKDERHIAQMVEDCHIPGYLNRDEIEKFYHFDLNFESAVSSLINEKKQFEEEIRMNPLLAKAAAGKDEEIAYFLSQVRKTFDDRIRQAKEDDAKQSASIRHIYEVFLKESDEAVEKLYQERLKDKNGKDETIYRKNVERFNSDLSEEELRELSEAFNPDYKDGARYIEDCKNRIQNLKVLRQKDRLESLRSEGIELLECRLFDDALSKFEEYLGIDPNNEEMHLRCLMAEKKVINREELFDYYKNLYFYEIPETKTAVEEESAHIEEICARCFIEGMLEKQEIRKKYQFDRNYESLVNCRTLQRRQIEDEIRLDPNFKWLSDHGSADLKQDIEELLRLYDQRLEEAREQEERSASQIRKNYRSFIKSKDKEVRSLYNELNRKRNRMLKEERFQKKESEKVSEETKEKEVQPAVQEAPVIKEEVKEELPVTKEEAPSVKQELSAVAETAKEESLAPKADVLKQKTKEEKEEALKKRQEELNRKREELKQERERKALEKQEKKKEEQLRKQEKKEASAVKRKAFLEKASRFKANIPLLTAGASLILLAVLVYIYVLVPSNKYNKAMSLASNGSFDEAIVLFVELGDYKDAAYRVKETTYAKADDLYKHNDTVAAAQIFYGLRFDDSEDRLKAIEKELISDAKAGDTIIFGAYEQDGSSANGKELIEWIVLEAQQGRILVLSKNVLDGRSFNDDASEVYWENSSLRSWLNGRFPDNAFSSENPSDVLQATLFNEKYPQAEEGEEPEELILEEYETRDRLFLLSSEELENYFPEESSRICQASEFAIENGVTATSENNCNWWLRSPGADRNQVQYVWSQFGSIASSPQEVVQGIRPALWLKRD